MILFGLGICVGIALVIIAPVAAAIIAGLRDSEAGWRMPE